MLGRPAEEPVSFLTPAAFRSWLARHHADRSELWVGFYKVATGKPSMTWDQSVDEALCFGWIDGVRKGIDPESYKIRFTPRRATSVWSLKNINSVERLIAEGRMMPPGLRAFEERAAERSGAYALERDEIASFAPELERRFRASRTAWRHFTSQPPGY